MPPRTNPKRDSRPLKKSKASPADAAAGGSAHPPPLQPPIPPVTSIRWFKSENQRLSYERKYLNRTVAKGKILTRSECESLHLNTFALFDAIGLGEFVSLDVPYYPKLVRLFYAHLISVADVPVPTLYSFVAGTDIFLDLASIRRLLNLPEGGIQYYTSHMWYAGDGFNPLDAVRQISHDQSITNIMKIKSRQLTLEARLVYNIIMYTIFPKSGGRSDVSFMEAFLVWCVLNGKRFDLSFLIFHHLLDCKKHGVHLYYAMALTRIFTAKGVNLDICISATHGPRDRINTTMLKIMKLQQDTQGHWYDPKFIEGADHSDSEEAEEDLDRNEPLETAIPPSSSTDVPPTGTGSFGFPQEIRDMLVENLEIAKRNERKLDDLTRKVDALATSRVRPSDLTELSDRIEEIAGQVGSHTENLSDLRLGLDLPPF